MGLSTDNSRETLACATPAKAERYTGEIVYMYAFDVAYEMTRAAVRELFGQPLAPVAVDVGKPGPRQSFFYRPQMVRLPPVQRTGPVGPIHLDRRIKLLPLGAISITVRIPFAVERMEELVAYHDLRFGGDTLDSEVRRLVTDTLQELRAFYVRPVAELGEAEAYAVFCLNAPLPAVGDRVWSTADWLRENRRVVAALLTKEPNAAQLSEQEVTESIGRHLSYYEHDLVVIDWDAALVIDEPRNFAEVLHLIELANLQLAELEAYDRMLDAAVERAYRDLSGRATRRRRNVIRELREIRIDLARFSDELSNTTKFFGDWHLARIYQSVAARFHLADWHRSIDEKLKTLDDLYELLKHEQNERWMLILEATIVVLFIIDLVLLVSAL